NESEHETEVVLDGKLVDDLVVDLEGGCELKACRDHAVVGEDDTCKEGNHRCKCHEADVLLLGLVKPGANEGPELIEDQGDAEYQSAQKADLNRQRDLSERGKVLKGNLQVLGGEEEYL